MTNARKSILVTDAERGSALSFVRSAARAGYRVFAVSKIAEATSFRSRYLEGFEVCPDPHAEPDLFTDAIVDFAQRYTIDLIVPITEDSILPLSAARERFDNGTQLAIAAPNALATALNKQKTLASAEALGIPCPTTHFVGSSSDLQAVGDRLTWPVVVKPQFSIAIADEEGSFEECKISYASSTQDIEERLQTASGRYGFLLQDYCGGRGVGIELLVWNGVIQSAFQHVRLAEVPVTGGASALRMSAAPDPALLEHSRRLVEHLRWSGLCMIEFRGEGSSARLMEMNGRVWGSLPLAVQSGMDFPAQLVRLMLGDGEEDEQHRLENVNTSYRTGHKAYNPDLLTVWFGSVLRGTKAPVPHPSRMDALRLLPHCWQATSDLHDTEDPSPNRGTARRLLRKIAAKFTSAPRTKE